MRRISRRKVVRIEALKKITCTDEISIYEVIPEDDEGFYRYVFSTKETRDICNYPEIVGIPFTDGLRRGISRFLSSFPHFERFSKKNQYTISVMNFLRGGLNFGLREALNEAYGFENHPSSFMTSQRYMIDKKWVIQDSQYRKLKFPLGASVFMGDIVATGSTIENGLEVIYQYAKEKKIELSNFIFFTIGGSRAEKIMKTYHERFRRLCKGYESTIVVYIEGRFRMANDDEDLMIYIPGTDLLRHDALIAPEYELSQYDDISIPLERCTIYDGGSRSFDVLHHIEDVKDYWSQLLALAEKGVTLKAAYQERWPVEMRANGEGASRQACDPEQIKDMASKAGKVCFLLDRDGGNKNLIEICRKRLEALDTI